MLSQKQISSVVFTCLMLLSVGCGQQRVVDPEKLPALSEDEVREILQEVVATGDTGSAEIARVHNQVIDEGKIRENYQAINDRLLKMIVNTNPDKNKELARQVLDLW